MFDAIIVGGGPAGLSAALILGRCRRNVLVCDSGEYRNAAAHALHGFLTRDGIEPAELRQVARDELRRYETVEIWDVEVSDARRVNNHFKVTLNNEVRVASRKLLLATGVVDDVPEIEGITSLYGRSVFHCPYCDGWEIRDEPIAIYGRGERGYGLSVELTLWSRDLVLCTDGPSEIDDEKRERLTRNGIPIREERIERLEGTDGILERIVFAGGASIARRAMFFTTGQSQQSALATTLGCNVNEKGTVMTGKYETTHLRGLFVAGDASRAVQWVVVAAAEGAEAAFAINSDLLKDDLR